MKCKKYTCKAIALKNDSYCYMHSKKISNAERHKARSKGGKNKIIKVNSKFENYELKSFKDILNLNERLINDVLQNKISLQIITGVCYNLQLQMKLISLENVENRISELEKTVFNPEAARKAVEEMFVK